MSMTQGRIAAPYAFLSKPPPQKKRPTQPPPPPPAEAVVVWEPATRPRSSTFSHITSWAVNVQPGSPAPVSPQRRPSVTSPRRPSIFAISPRRLSVPSIRVSSASFLNFLDTPTTAHKAAYTPLVVEFPTEPQTAGLPSRTVGKENKDSMGLFGIPIPPMPTSSHNNDGRVLDRMKSWSVFGSRGRSKSVSAPTASKVSKEKVAAEIASRKKKGYKFAYNGPVPLAAQLELAQFMDGGSMNHCIQNHMEARARAENGLGRGDQVVGVGDVWRDEEGGIWLDREEELEFAHLLSGGVGFEDTEWVDFEAGSPVDEVRRGSVQSSELDPDRTMPALKVLDDNLPVLGGDFGSTPTLKPAMSSPAARRRSISHLGLPGLYARPTQRRELRDAGDASRRRPAPLMLPPPSPVSKRPINSPVNPEQVRRDFLINSFEPDSGSLPHINHGGSRRVRRASLARHPNSTIYSSVRGGEGSTAPPSRRAATKKPSVMNMKGLLRAVGGKKDASR